MAKVDGDWCLITRESQWMIMIGYTGHSHYHTKWCFVQDSYMVTFMSKIAMWMSYTKVIHRNVHQKDGWPTILYTSRLVQKPLIMWTSTWYNIRITGQGIARQPWTKKGALFSLNTHCAVLSSLLNTNVNACFMKQHCTQW